MPRVPIPFTDQSVDPTGDPTGAVWTVGLLAVGAGLFGVAFSFGDDIRSFIMNSLPFGQSGDGGATLQLGA